MQNSVSTSCKGCVFLLLRLRYGTWDGESLCLSPVPANTMYHM